MGFMDKAKKLAEQAQQKLDEAQTQFNQNQNQPQPQAGGVQYDEHGRPVQQSPPAGAPTAQPSTPTPDPSAPPADEPEAPPRPAPSGGANASPDPFKPLQ